jgi:hypothetical protein
MSLPKKNNLKIHKHLRLKITKALLRILKAQTQKSQIQGGKTLNRLEER